MSARPLVQLWNLGRVRYLPALKIQETLVANILQSRQQQSPDDKDNVLLVVEHEPVYTTGIRTRGYSAEEETFLRGLGADFVRTNRGGLITFHGPGQLVTYPILDLKDFVPEGKTKTKALLGR